MKKILHIAKSNISRHKAASMSLFIIILIVSVLMTISLSIFLGVQKDFETVMDRSNTLHSVFILTKDVYNPSFEDVIKNDSRVSGYEISQVLSPGSVEVNYGGETDIRAMIFNLEKPLKISAPVITEEDLSIPREQAIYLPVFAKGLGYNTGDVFTMIYKNKPIDLRVAGFFESNDFSVLNMGMCLKFFAPEECYEMLRQQFGTSVWISVRFNDIADSIQFNNDFASAIDIDLSDFSFYCDADGIAVPVITPVTVITSIIVIFAILIVLISLLVVRFRVMNNIEDTMHEIGVLKASGYTSSQIISCYLMEYGIISVLAALIGIIASVPLFSLVRQAMTSTSGFLWSLEANIVAGLLAAILIVSVLLVMVLSSCRKIKVHQPVEALRGGIAVKNLRRNSFPLHKGAGNLQTRLGLKSIIVFLKTYVLVGVVIAVMAVASICVTTLYQAFVLDTATFARMAGFEVYDIELKVTRHTDADKLAAELENLPEVRKTSMLDWVTYQVDGVDAVGYVSNDFGKMESMYAHDGRFPEKDNEIAVPKLFADQLGKNIGDYVAVRASGVSQDYVITGLFSNVNNMGRTAAVTLEGHQRLDPNYKRNTVTVYLSEGATFEGFSEILKNEIGVLNVYKKDENGKFAGAKAVAEEKISNYLEHYDIDSVEYAVIYNGEIILSGSSGEYQVEKITNMYEMLNANLGTYMQIVSLIVQIVLVLSLIIIALIISMTVRSIITKRRRELGTLKAVGFTTKQLTRQLAVSFLPCVAIGAAAGCITGALVTDPALTSLFAVMGAYGTLLTVNPVVVLLIGALFFLAAFAFIYIAAGRIRNISAYELIADGPIVQKVPARKRTKRAGSKKIMAVFLTFLILFPLTANNIYALDEPGADQIGAGQAGADKLYGIGSVSKVFTAAAVMKLADEGKLDLDTPIISYIPEFKMADKRYDQITPRMLLNHSSGFMGTTDVNGFLYGDNDTYHHDHILDLLAVQTLKHDPGDRSIYCNDGFTVAEILVERISGLSFTEFIDRNFSAPLGLENIKTPQSDFDRGRLADVYRGSNPLKPENVGLIGSGGIYATMNDLCRFALVFMDSSDGSVLSKQAAQEMAKNQHMKEVVSPDADTVVRYGLGWDCVALYPFSKYGIKALSKGGSTALYHTNLIVLPEYNIAAAVSSSGKDGQEQIIAQEIIIAVLKAEGIIPENAAVTIPLQNLERAEIPESIKTYAGLYTAGLWGQWEIKFTDDSLMITPIMVKNERPREYIYNTDGEFVSTNGDYIGINESIEGMRGITSISFAEDRYLVINTYEELPGLGGTAVAMPLAEKIESNPVSAAAIAAWEQRNGNEYLLVSEKYSSSQYISGAVAKTLTDDRLIGYVGMGVYRGNGALINMAKIIDENKAEGFQSIPTMTGRDTNDLSTAILNGAGYLNINGTRFIDSSAAKKFSETGDKIVIGTETVWIDIDEEAGGQIINIETPQNGAWFVYDNKMNCVATSLEAKLRSTIILPENGRLAFAGESGAVFEYKTER